MRGRLVGLAALLSFSVHLVPLVGPHAVVLLGEWLARAPARGDRATAWWLTSLLVALALQAVAGVAWYAVLRLRGVARALVLLPVVPAVVVAANWLFLVVLPVRLLIDPETAVAQGAWPVLCSVSDAVLGVPGRKPAVVRRSGSSAVRVQGASGRWSMLAVSRAPGASRCDLRPVDLGFDPRVAPLWAADDGRALVSRFDAAGGASFEWIPGPGGAATRLEPPPGRRASDPAPVVDDDGRAVAWIVPVPRSGQPPAPSLVIRPLPPRAPGGRGDGNASGGDAREIVVDLARAGPGHVVVLDVDMQAREALVAVDERRFVSMGFDGGVRWGPVRPEGVEPIHATFRRVGDGWVAWDGYRESGPYVVAWTLPAGRGTHRVPRGRGITDIAVHPDGRLLALSLTTSLSIGDVQDAVYVLRAAAGGEVFRRFLPRYARSAVAFPAPDLFAYTEWDGTRFATVVLEIPDAVR